MTSFFYYLPITSVFIAVICSTFVARHMVLYSCVMIRDDYSNI